MNVSKHIGGWLIVLLLTGSAQATTTVVSPDGNMAVRTTPSASGSSTLAPNKSVPPSAGNVAANEAEVDEPPGLLLVLLGSVILILWMRRWPQRR